MPPPYDYDLIFRQFRDTRGTLVDRKAVREEVDKLIEHAKREARRLADDVKENRISVSDFELAMRELLKSAHIIAGSVGKGGRERMTQSDWGRVGAKVKWQYGFLRKLARKIETGRITDALTRGRAQAYSSAILTTFYKSFADEQIDGGGTEVRRIKNSKESCDGCMDYIAMGWIPVEEMPLLGELECGDFDACDLEFR